MKTYQKDFLFLVSISLIYFIPLYFLGAERMEDYTHTHFTLKILAKNLFSPFLFYHDLLGPGSRLPLGNGLNFFFPPTLFIENIHLFYLTSILLGFYIQLNFFKKIFSLFDYKYSYLLIILYSFNITFLANLITGDSIKTFFSLSLLVPIFYYLIKFLKTEKKENFFKLLIFYIYFFLNSHPIQIIIFSFSILLFVIFNKKYFFFKKKYFYIGLFLTILVFTEKIYRLFYEFSLFSGGIRPLIVEIYLYHFSSGVVFILKFFEDFLNLNFPFLSKTDVFDNRILPFGGIFFYFSFFWSLRLIFKKDSKSILYLNYIFLLMILFSLLDLNKLTFAILNNSHTIRDIINFFSILIFGNFIIKIKNKKIFYFVVITALLTTFMHTSSTIKMHHSSMKGSNNNFFKKNNNFENQTFYNLFKQKSYEQNFSGKTYLSEGIWKFLYKTDFKERRIFNQENIFHPIDFFQYDIFLFNGEFKNASKYQIRKSDRKMYSTIEPRLDEINNKFFFDLFGIRYLLIFESEINKIDFSKFREITRLKNQFDDILFLERKRLAKVTVNDLNQLEDNNCKSYPMVDCLLSIESLFNLSKEIEIERLSLNKYQITNNSNKSEKIVLPFLYDYGWKSKKGFIDDMYKTFLYIEMDPKTKNIIYYRDTIRFYLKIISIFIFLCMISIVIIIKLKLQNLLKLKLNNF